MIIACVLKSGGEYNAQYVTRLYQGCLRFAHSYFQFTCITDLPAEEFPHEISVVPLEHGWPGWWSKMELFRPGLFPLDEQVFYMDLDTMIVGNIRHIVECDCVFAGLEDFYGVRASGLATGLLSWRGNSGIPDKIYESALDFVPKKITERNWKKHWDQIFVKDVLSEIGITPVFLQREFPGEILSWKKDCAGGVPALAKIICFHGNPRPHTLSGSNPVVDQYWRD